jgi:GrpB-like predicted nucleotidyltransferase (UPF0157 family)
MFGGHAMIGIKRGSVILCAHEKEWEANATTAIIELTTLLGPAAMKIQHVGSTSIKAIKAKPIIDIAVGVRDFADVRQMIPELESHGFFHCPETTMNGSFFLRREVITRKPAIFRLISFMSSFLEVFNGTDTSVFAII